MKSLSTKWQKLIVWLTGYLNTIAFVLAGGFIYLKTEDDDVKTSAKTVLFLLAIFTGLEILRGIVYNILSVANVTYDVLSVVSDIGTVISIIKMIVFVTLFILDLVGIKLLPVKTNASDENKA